ncbi:MAG: antibiotic biosynthesis monooxygenase family protein [Sulfobacillus sp.]
MIVVANRIYVAAGFESAFEERFRARPRQVEQAAGFVRNELLKPRSQGAPYVVLTHWQDEACFRSWTESPAFRAAHGAPRPPEGMFSQPNVLEMHEVLAV